MTLGGQKAGLERLAVGRTAVACAVVHATLVTWIDAASPSTTAPGLVSAVAWAVTEHPGRCAVAVTLVGWSLWKPRPASRQGAPEGQPSPSVESEALVESPIEL